MLVNGQLAEHGTVFEATGEMPLGIFGTSVLGRIKGFAVRLDFSINPANNRRAVHLFDIRTKDLLAERLAAPTFEEAIAEYPWSAVIAALALR